MKFIAPIVAIALPLTGNAAVQHVDLDAAGGDGSTWAAAFSSPGPALAAAAPGDQVWIAEGTYIGSWTIPSDVEVYGGFDGSETALNERDFESHLTIFSGDVNQDDDGLFSLRNDNISELVSIDNAKAVVLDGVIITNSGHLDESSDAGSAVVIQQGDAVIRNCTFQLNGAEYGGAISTLDTNLESGNDLSIENCLFAENHALEAGGAIHNYRGGVLNISNSQFHINTARRGGGVFNDGSHCDVHDSVFTHNEAALSGALYARGIFESTQEIFRTIMSVNGSHFEANRSSNHSSVTYLYTADFHATNCTFTANTGGEALGGLLTNMLNARAWIDNCVVSNHAGGPVFHLIADENYVYVRNSLLENNNVNFQILAASGNTVNEIHIESTTVAQDSPAASISAQGGSASITNSILHNTFFSGGGTFDIRHSLLPFPWPGDGNIVGDAEFADAGNGDYNLRPESPALNAGILLNDMPETDLNGNPRLFGLSAPDLGCFELQQAPPGDVDTTGVVNQADLEQLLLHFGETTSEPTLGDIYPYPAGDGVVNFHDLNQLLRYWNGN